MTPDEIIEKKQLIDFLKKFDDTDEFYSFWNERVKELFLEKTHPNFTEEESDDAIMTKKELMKVLNTFNDNDEFYATFTPPSINLY